MGQLKLTPSGLVVREQEISELGSQNGASLVAVAVNGIQATRLDLALAELAGARQAAELALPVSRTVTITAGDPETEVARILVPLNHLPESTTYRVTPFLLYTTTGAAARVTISFGAANYLAQTYTVSATTTNGTISTPFVVRKSAIDPGNTGLTWATIRIAAPASGAVTFLGATLVVRSGTFLNPEVSNLNALFVGHSLVNTDIPWMWRNVALASSLTSRYREQLNIGAALKSQWENPGTFNSIPVWNADLGANEEWGVNAQTELATGTYHTFVVTEAIPVDTQDNTALYVGNYYDLAVQHRPDIRPYLFETWDFVVTGNYAAWRTKINTWRPVWEGIVDTVMASRPNMPTMHIVPGGQAMAALYDEIAATGSVGTITAISQLFTDDIHLNDTGNYFMALVFYATLYRRDPSGTGAVHAGPFKTAETTVVQDATTRAALQALAWRVVREYSRAGVTP